MDDNERIEQAAVMAHPTGPFDEAIIYGPWLECKDPRWDFAKYRYRVRPITMEEYEAMPWVNDWAKWRAFDQDGELCEFGDRPICEAPIWVVRGRDACLIRKTDARPLAFDWEDSLQERPKPKKRPWGYEEFYAHRNEWFRSKAHPKRLLRIDGFGEDGAEGRTYAEFCEEFTLEDGTPLVVEEAGDKQKLTLWRTMLEDHYQYIGGTGSALEWPYDAISELIDEVMQLRADNERLRQMACIGQSVHECRVSDAESFKPNDKHDGRP